MMNYFKNKEENIKKAVEHIKLMEDIYSKEILHSTRNTVCNLGINPARRKMDQEYIYEFSEVIIDDKDVITALLETNNDNGGRIAVLNFADYKFPGGKFLEGSMAQEESLCHHSILYNVLSNFSELYYAQNRKDLRRGLYYDKSLYSKDILFDVWRDGVRYKFTRDVITCAAPFAKTVLRYKFGTKEDVEEAMRNRILHIIQVAVNNEVDTLILGAFGCGVFGNDPEFVATTFRDYLNGPFAHSFQKVVFAIPKGHNNKVFRRVFMGL